MARWFSIKPGLTLKGRKFKGLRGFAGKPFHPPLTDIPIGAYTLAAAFDILSWLLAPDRDSASAELFSGGSQGLAADLNRAATFCLIAGAIVSIPTMLTGFWDWWKSTQAHTQAWRTANWHMAVMIFNGLLVLADIWWRNQGGAYTELGPALLSAVIFGVVALGASYGGSLVYDYGFNVETSGDHPVWHESETDVFPGHE